MLTDDGYRQLMKHAKRLAQEGHGELAQHLRDAIDLRAEVEALRADAREVYEWAEPVWARPDQLRQVPFLCALYKTQAAPDLVPLYRHPPAAEVQLQGGLDNDELLEAWRTKVPGVEPTGSDLRAFALGVEVGDVGRRTYFLERNSARDAWLRRMKQSEALKAEVQRLRDALKTMLENFEHGDLNMGEAAALAVARCALEGK